MVCDMTSRFARTPSSEATAPAKPKSFAQRVRHVAEERPAPDNDEPVSVSSSSPTPPTPSRFTRASSVPTAPLDIASLPKSWGFDENTIVPSPSGWQACACPKCSKKDGPVLCAQMNSEGGFFCVQCGFHGNITQSPRSYRDSWVSLWRAFLTDPTRPTTPPAILPANSVGCTAPAWENGQWVDRWHAWCMNNDRLDDSYIYNDELLSWSRPLFTTPTPYGWFATEGARVVFVAHMEDVLPLKEAAIDNVVCLPPDMNAVLTTSPAWRVLETIEKRMGEVTEIVLALRSTPDERALEEELGRRLDRERCFRVRWRPDDDEVHVEEAGPLDVLTRYGKDQLNLMVEVAPPFPVIGVYELQDIEDKFDELYRTGLAPGASTGWPSVDQYYTIKTGQWTVVTGIPGHGKSSWLDGLLVNLASYHGWRFGLFSPENQPVERHFASLMEKKLKKPFTDGPTARISEEEKNRTKRWLNDRFKVILPDEENGVWTLDAVLDLAKTLVYRYGIRGLVIDPWNELDHSRPNSVNETSHISESLTKVRRFARLYDVHVWIVAHPTKLEKKATGKYPVPTPYDISGGAHWRNKADNALSIYRNPEEVDDDITDIYVQKVRFKEVGRVGITSLRSDRVSGSYVDDIDHTKREYALAKGEYHPSTSMRTHERVYQTQVEPLEYDHDF